MNPDEAALRPGSADQNCGNCIHFDAETQMCDVLNIPVGPSMVCDYWESLAESQGMMNEVASIFRDGEDVG